MWYNYKQIAAGQEIHGIEQNDRIYFARGMTIKEVHPLYVLIRHGHGEIERVDLDTKFYVRGQK
jgi:hypothetical protein